MDELLLTKEERDEVYDNLPSNATAGDERRAFCQKQLEKAYEPAKAEGRRELIEELKWNTYINNYGDREVNCKWLEQLLKELGE